MNTAFDLDLDSKEIEGYVEYPAFKEKCLTDCIWPFESFVISEID